MGNLQLCPNYRTVSLIIHPSKVLLKVIINRLKPLAENIIAAEQAGFRAGRSTTDQIFNVRILYEKCLQHQQDIYHAIVSLISRKLFIEYGIQLSGQPWQITSSAVTVT